MSIKQSKRPNMTRIKPNIGHKIANKDTGIFFIQKIVIFSIFFGLKFQTFSHVTEMQSAIN